MPLLFDGDETIDIDAEVDVVPTPDQSPLRIPAYMAEYEDEIEADNYTIVDDGDAYEFRRPYVLIIRRQVDGDRIWYSEIQADVGESRQDEAEPARSREAAIDRAVTLSERTGIPVLSSILEPDYDEES